MNLSSGIKAVRSVVTANSPVLLVGTAITGIVATGVLAARGGYKARGIIDEAQAKLDTEPESRQLTVQEQFQLTWLCYAAPALTGASTVLSVVGVHTIHNKRHAALAGLYAVTTNRIDEYTEKAEELLGPKKTQELTNAVAQKRIDETELVNHEVIITGEGKELCYDEWSGRYFMGSLPIIEQAINEVNRSLLNDDGASINDFYDWVGLTPIESGNDMGWSGKKINGKFGAVTSPDGRPAISVWFQRPPAPLARSKR